MKNEIHISFVISKHAFAKILNIDPSKALQSEEVVGFYCAKDIAPSNNKFTMVVSHDEWLFADDFVHCEGQIIGVVGKKNALKIIGLVRAKYWLFLEDLVMSHKTNALLAESQLHSLF